MWKKIKARLYKFYSACDVNGAEIVVRVDPRLRPLSETKY